MCRPSSGKLGPGCSSARWTVLSGQARKSAPAAASRYALTDSVARKTAIPLPARRPGCRPGQCSPASHRVVMRAEFSEAVLIERPKAQRSSLRGRRQDVEMPRERPAIASGYKQDITPLCRDLALTPWRRKVKTSCGCMGWARCGWGVDGPALVLMAGDPCKGGRAAFRCSIALTCARGKDVWGGTYDQPD